MRALSLDEANTIIAATFAAAKKHKCRPMSAIVLDAGGRVKAFQKQDNASMLRFEVCYGKAYASLALGRPSKLVLHKANEKPLFMQSIENLADYPLVPGRRRAADPRQGRRGDRRDRRHRRRQRDGRHLRHRRHPCRGARAPTAISSTIAEAMRVLSIHKSAPLVDPRPKQRLPRKPHRMPRRNGSGRRHGGATAKTGP